MAKARGRTTALSEPQRRRGCRREAGLRLAPPPGDHVAALLGCTRAGQGSLTGKDYIYRSFMANGNRADTTMTPAKTCTKQTGWPPLPMTAKRIIAAKILPAWTRRFGSIALLDFIPRIRVVIRSKDLHVLCYSRAFRVSSVSSRVKGPGCDRSRSRETKETRRLALAAVATTRSSLTASV